MKADCKIERQTLVFGGIDASPVRKNSRSGAQADRGQIMIALGVIIGVTLYIVTVIFLGSLRPGYNHFTQLISELGEAGTPNADFLNLVLIFDGLILIAFGIGLHRGISEGKGSKIGPGLVAVFGMAVLGGGMFPCDPGCVQPVSFSGYMHAITGLPALIAVPLAPIILSRRLKKDSRWRGYDTFSLVCGIVAIPLMITSSTYFPSIGLIGLGQRLLLIVQLVWPMVMAIQLLRLSLRPSA